MSMDVREDTVDHLTVDAIVNHDEYGIPDHLGRGLCMDVGPIS